MTLKLNTLKIPKEDIKTQKKYIEFLLDKYLCKKFFNDRKHVPVKDIQEQQYIILAEFFLSVYMSSLAGKPIPHGKTMTTIFEQYYKSKTVSIYKENCIATMLATYRMFRGNYIDKPDLEAILRKVLYTDANEKNDNVLEMITHLWTALSLQIKLFDDEELKKYFLYLSTSFTEGLGLAKDWLKEQEERIKKGDFKT